jgi:murein DD-endopeptidase MepM/ murein hydrolase activator NlpD
LRTVERWSLGGRSLKRAFPRNVKSAIHCEADNSTAIEQSRQASSGVNRRTRTSAAMIGLALSMGAANLLLPRQDDGAIAAEPQATESMAVVPMPLDVQAATSPSPSRVTEAEFTSSLPAASAIDHVIQPGQTLWQLARRYHVDVEVLAAANGLTTASILQTGRTLKIPTSFARVGSDRAALTSASESNSTRSSFAQSQSIDGLASDSVDRQLKGKQDDALVRLRQSREKLRSGLAGLRSEASRDAKLPVSSIASVSQEIAVPEQPEMLVEVAIMPRVASADGAMSSSVASGTTDTSQLYQVKSGDTLSSIARTYSVSQRELVTLNRLNDPDWLRANQSLALPPDAAIASTTVAPIPPLANSVAPRPAPLASGTANFQSEPTEMASVAYRVTSGDTLSSIAGHYGIPQSLLADVNALGDPNQIRVNQVLMIPNPALGATVSSPTLATAPIDRLPTPARFVLQPDSDNPGTFSTASRYPAVNVPTVPSTHEEVSAAEVAVDTPASGTSDSVALSSRSEATAIHRRTESAGGAHQVSNHYVDNLMSEILSLRDRYRTEASDQAAPTQSPTLAFAPASVDSVAPESSNDPLTEAFQAEVRRLRVEQQAQQSRPLVSVQTPTVPPLAVAPTVITSPSQPTTSPANAGQMARTQGQVVAVAPLGSENYEPLVQPMTGRLVSPDLPPLPAGDAYLPQDAAVSNGYAWPTRGVITSGYGRRWGRMHRGIDIGAPIGTPVIASAGGVVEFSGWNSGGYGNMVDIRHPDGSMTRYAHNSRLLVRTGQQVDQGQQISEVGSTGYSTGPHLHFEVHPRNQGAVNPIAYLPQSRS